MWDLNRVAKRARLQRYRERLADREVRPKRTDEKFIEVEQQGLALSGDMRINCGHIPVFDPVAKADEEVEIASARMIRGAPVLGHACGEFPSLVIAVDKLGRYAVGLRVGRKLLMRRTELDRWLESQKIRPAAPASTTTITANVQPKPPNDVSHLLAKLGFAAEGK